MGGGAGGAYQLREKLRVSSSPGSPHICRATRLVQVHTAAAIQGGGGELVGGLVDSAQHMTATESKTVLPLIAA